MQATHFRPERTILELGDDFYDAVAPADFPATTLRFRNDRAAAEVGLAELDDAEWVRHFGRFAPLDGSLPQPLALRYHGHQFRSYNPDIGDGRGFLFAQMRDADGRLMDFGTKGSGQTPYSRFGDGRLTLKGAVREILATEMLEALGVRTSRTFSVIETHEALDRHDEPSPTRSAVLVRLSHGHIRYGSFQRQATLGNHAALRRLVDYSLEHLLGEAPGGEDAPVRLLTRAARDVAGLAASYIAAGFVHGVLNSDNISITAESFDYGPWRFAPTWDPGFTAAYFDHQGLYAFTRQPGAIYWGLNQLALALLPISSGEALTPARDSFVEHYEAALRDAFFRRLGVRSKGPQADFDLMGEMEKALRTSGVGFDRFWFDWRGGALRRASALYDGAEFAPFRDAVAGFEPAVALDHPHWADDVPCSMLIDEVEAIWAPIAERDDWSALHAKVEAVRRMGTAYRG